MENRNNIAQIIQFLSIISIVAGLGFGMYTFGETENLLLALTPLGYFCVTGIILLGFAEIIKLLDNIFRKISGGTDVVPAATQVAATSTGGTEDRWDVTKFHDQLLQDYCKREGISYSSIKQTPFEDYFFVRSEDPHLIDTKGFKAERVTRLKDLPEIEKWLNSEVANN